MSDIPIVPRPATLFFSNQISGLTQNQCRKGLDKILTSRRRSPTKTPDIVIEILWQTPFGEH
jgi:hypothetical protein